MVLSGCGLAWYSSGSVLTGVLWSGLHNIIQARSLSVVTVQTNGLRVHCRHTLIVTLLYNCYFIIQV